MSGNNTVEITRENAQRYLIDESYERPVLIDFWADWCAPCKALMPVLEKLADAYDGAFLLAKVNADEFQQIAAQFGVRSLPTVVVMNEGQPVDAFQGAQPETAIRELIDKHLPDPWDRLMQLAQEKIQAGDYAGALPELRRAYEESRRRSDIGLALAHTWLQLNRADEAEAVLDRVPEKDRDAMFEQLMGQLELSREAAKPDEIRALEEKLAAQPENPDILYQLANACHRHNLVKEALEFLLGILERDRDYRDGAAKGLYLDIIKGLAKGDPLATEFQRKFYNLMY
jgi:putative thioredoxin